MAKNPFSAFEMCAVATSIIVSAPPTKGSLTNPTLASSKTHKPSHLYGLMTKIELFMASPPLLQNGHVSFYDGSQRTFGPLSCQMTTCRHPSAPTLLHATEIDS